ncbi:lipoate--protein ligase family protein [Tenuibacillus multivorans]|uniref:Octanoyl-[GcvH]:protein N-octanoyltransferase n=1 Tax=Tenuibacillus multivorans TaxID=237069 RepID=A0A1G9WY43_9BACI|nr:lipoate--protein ligase family protein [Tenuibacillus multivorans]GEL77307.1 octanoyl-[GcvH]:protein N-octanoyltransferase [Tenuibacillus multivorans]SDM89338.1 octanoyl-[GcvH]:protein N-octanoyltransferase/lipoyl amidotransferase [Tenuibacillus multivorans]
MNHTLLNFKTIRKIDHRNAADVDIIESFATDDTLCLTASEIGETAIRYWVHQPTVVLGIPDSRLPYIDEGIQYIKDQGYQVIIRNSGGLAVVLDEGILNISLIFPEAKTFDIHDGYQAMVEFIRWVLNDEGCPIEAYEIEQSYCPGEYDLSIDGKKFAGISQRRVKNGSAVQIYLDIEGNGQERAQLLKTFYEISLKGESTKFKYPDIDPTVMASLDQLFQKDLTVEQVIKRIEDKLNTHGVTIDERPFSEQEKHWYKNRLELMRDRNKKIL